MRECGNCGDPLPRGMRACPACAGFETTTAEIHFANQDEEQSEFVSVEELDAGSLPQIDADQLKADLNRSPVFGDAEDSQSLPVLDKEQVLEDLENSPVFANVEETPSAEVEAPKRSGEYECLATNVLPPLPGRPNPTYLQDPELSGVKSLNEPPKPVPAPESGPVGDDRSVVDMFDAAVDDLIPQIDDDDAVAEDGMDVEPELPPVAPSTDEPVLEEEPLEEEPVLEEPEPVVEEIELDAEPVDEPVLEEVAPEPEPESLPELRFAPEEDEIPVVDEVEPIEVEPIEEPGGDAADGVVMPTLVPVAADGRLDAPVVAELEPRDGNPPLEVRIDARFEVDSLAQDSADAVNLLVTLEPTGEPLVSSTDGPVAHVILALDVSASMDTPEKYPVLTQALERMIRDLQAPGNGEVLLSVVLFAYGAQTLFRDVPASELDPKDVLASLDRSDLRFGGYTDIVGGLKRAGRIAYDAHYADKCTPLRIIVLTDGDPQDVDGARKVMTLLGKLPVDVEGLAFGNDANVEILQSLISGHRGGTVKHVRPETLGTAFGHIAESAQRVVAKRALIDVELRRGVVGGSAYRFRPARHRYSDHAFVGGRDFHRDIGTLETGSNYSLMFQLKLPETKGGETEVGRFTLRVPGFGGARTFECLLSLPRHQGQSAGTPDPAVVSARHILEALDDDDTAAELRALHARRRLYVAERRDPYLIEVIDRAIAELEDQGSLADLSNAERSALLAHTDAVPFRRGKAAARPGGSE